MRKLGTRMNRINAMWLQQNQETFQRKNQMKCYWLCSCYAYFVTRPKSIVQPSRKLSWPYLDSQAAFSIGCDFFLCQPRSFLAYFCFSILNELILSVALCDAWNFHQKNTWRIGGRQRERVRSKCVFKRRNYTNPNQNNKPDCIVFSSSLHTKPNLFCYILKSSRKNVKRRAVKKTSVKSVNISFLSTTQFFRTA